MIISAANKPMEINKTLLLKNLFVYFRIHFLSSLVIWMVNVIMNIHGIKPSETQINSNISKLDSIAIPNKKSPVIFVILPVLPKTFPQFCFRKVIILFFLLLNFACPRYRYQ